MVWKNPKTSKQIVYIFTGNAQRRFYCMSGATEAAKFKPQLSEAFLASFHPPPRRNPSCMLTAEKINSAC